VLVHPDEILTYKQRYADRAFLLDHILRMLGGGVYHEEMRFLPPAWARALRLELQELHGYLSQFAARGIISYQPASGTPTLRILTHRRRLLQQEVNWDRVEFLRIRAQDRLAAMLRYIHVPGRRCRSRILESYFGEAGTRDCGHCDHCLSRAAAGGGRPVRELGAAILAFLGDSEREMRDLIEQVQEGTREQRMAVVRQMLDMGILQRGKGLLVARAKDP
jgi:ATP-dependent DNA helicase RecQ